MNGFHVKLHFASRHILPGCYSRPRMEVLPSATPLHHPSMTSRSICPIRPLSQQPRLCGICTPLAFRQPFFFYFAIMSPINSGLLHTKYFAICAAWERRKNRNSLFRYFLCPWTRAKKSHHADDEQNDRRDDDKYDIVRDRLNPCPENECGTKRIIARVRRRTFIYLKWRPE